MRKINPNQENPIDNVLIELSELTFPFFNCLGFTANDITTLSLIFGLISIYALYKNKITIFVTTYLLSYFFDIADGGYARRYKITSKAGCYYDHIKDLIINILLIGVLIHKHWSNKINLALIISYITIFGFMMSLHLGCQENLYTNNESPSLSIFKKMCKNNPEKTIQYTKFFGCGTYVFMFILLIIYMSSSSSSS
jgi:phosphatidylglycerophosphate synthase